MKYTSSLCIQEGSCSRVVWLYIETSHRLLIKYSLQLVTCARCVYFPPCPLCACRWPRVLLSNKGHISWEFSSFLSISRDLMLTGKGKKEILYTFVTQRCVSAEKFEVSLLSIQMPVSCLSRVWGNRERERERERKKERKRKRNWEKERFIYTAIGSFIGKNSKKEKKQTHPVF